jgi:hypothetical protein
VENFRKLVEQKVIERSSEKEKPKDRMRKWSITRTIVEENIECDVTIKVKISLSALAMFSLLFCDFSS